MYLFVVFVLQQSRTYSVQRYKQKKCFSFVRSFPIHADMCCSASSEPKKKTPSLPCSPGTTTRHQHQAPSNRYRGAGTNSSTSGASTRYQHQAPTPEPSTRHQAPTPGTKHHGLGTRHQVPSTRRQTPAPAQPAPGTRHQAPGNRHQQQATDTRQQAPRTRQHISMMQPPT